MGLIKKFGHIKYLINGEETLKVEKKIDLNRLESIRNVKSTNKNFYKTIVSCSGCGFSGSSAVTDFLAEFDCCSAFGGVTDEEIRGKNHSYEVDFFRGVNGILDFERICESPYFITQNNSIREFYKQVYYNYNSQCPIYDDFYVSETNNFLHKLIDYEIPDNGKLLGVKTSKTLSLTEYRKLGKDYIANVLKNIPSKEYLVLDQFLTLQNPQKELLDSYFDNYKIIFVWSDPRDMYLRGIAHKAQWWLPEDPELFVRFFIRNTESYFCENKNSNILCISFDELCNNYENETKKIKDFLSINNENHINRYKYFNPEISKNNTKLWKTSDKYDELKFIEQHLSQYCYK